MTDQAIEQPKLNTDDLLTESDIRSRRILIAWTLIAASVTAYFAATGMALPAALGGYVVADGMHSIAFVTIKRVDTLLRAQVRGMADVLMEIAKHMQSKPEDTQ